MLPFPLIKPTHSSSSHHKVGASNTYFPLRYFPHPPLPTALPWVTHHINIASHSSYLTVNNSRSTLRQLLIRMIDRTVSKRSCFCQPGSPHSDSRYFGTGYALLWFPCSVLLFLFLSCRLIVLLLALFIIIIILFFKHMPYPDERGIKTKGVKSPFSLSCIVRICSTPSCSSSSSSSRIISIL